MLALALAKMASVAVVVMVAAEFAVDVALVIADAANAAAVVTSATADASADVTAISTIAASHHRRQHKPNTLESVQGANIELHENTCCGEGDRNPPRPLASRRVDPLSVFCLSYSSIRRTLLPTLLPGVGSGSRKRLSRPPPPHLNHN